MSVSLDTVLQVVEIVNKAIEIYHKIQDAPDQMRHIGKRMERLNTLLLNLEALLRTKHKQALARLRPAQTEDLLDIIEDIRDDSEKVAALFDKWNNDIGPFGLQFTFKTLGQAYFALGSSSDKLAALGDDIELHRQDLRDYLQVMGAEGINALLLGQGNVGQQQNLSPGQVGTGVSPSPAPARNDYKIIFIDPHNIARSVVAEGYTKLLQAWTTRTNPSDWHIKTIRSAGFFVRNKNEVVDTIDSLKYTYASYKMPMSDGNAKPNTVPLDALFDNKLFDNLYKDAIRNQLANRRSRGLSKNIFKTYDYIIVFTGREHDNMVRLRKALAAKSKDTDDKDAVTTKGKGRILHLGHYLTLDGIPREIIDVPKDKDGNYSRSQWNFKVSQMKTAIKSFLRQETGWKQPPQGPRNG